MKNSNTLYWFLGYILALIATLVIFSRITSKGVAKRRVKETFLLFFIMSLTAMLFNLFYCGFIKHSAVPLIHSLWIITGLVFANFEFLFMKKRLHGNIIKNTFFIPSFIFLLIMLFVSSVFFLPFIDILDHHILRGKMLSFVLYFLFGYSSVLYWRFRQLEKTMGIIYFEKRILGFLKSKNKGNN